jgi:NADPH2:quinone reductase
MHAVQFEEPGPPDVMRLVELPMPKPNAGEVVIKAHAIGVGLPDLLVRSGRYPWMPPLPAIPGIEMSGIVDAIGEGVATALLGQPVLVSARERPHRCGCYAQYMVAKPTELFVLPPEVDLDAAAALANYQVAFHLIHSAARSRGGDTVLVYAAAGGVGSAAIELCNLSGISVIGVAGGAEKARFVRQLGVAHAVDRHIENIPARVRELTEGRGVDLILDPVGGSSFVDNLPLLAPLGLLVLYGALAGPPHGDLMTELNRYFGNSPGVRRFSMHSFDHLPAQRAEVTRTLIDYLAAGKIRPRIHARLPLSEAAQAHRLVEGGQVVGKLLLHP